MDFLLLQQMSLPEIKEYMLQIMMHEKKCKESLDPLQRKIQELEIKKQNTPLSQPNEQLNSTVNPLQLEINQLLAQKNKLDEEIAEVVSDMHQIKDFLSKRGVAPSIDSNQLLAQMDLFLGKPSEEITTEKKFKEKELNDELSEELKKLKEKSQKK